MLLAAVTFEDIQYYFRLYALNPLKALIILVIALIIAKIAASLITKTCIKSHLEETLARFLGKCARWAILALAVILILSIFGFETSSLAVILGSVGLAIGLAMQGTLGHIAAGVMLMIFRPFKVGHYIVVSGEEGLVEEIDLFTTHINTIDNRHIIIPNGSVFGSVIKNYTHNKYRRVDVAVGVTYGADLKQTREVLEGCLTGIENAVYTEENMPSQAYLKELGDSSVNWSLRVWTENANYWAVREELTNRAKLALDEAGISIPFPQMDVHLFKEGQD